MLLSIIIPVYNAEIYLKDCITSVLSQKGREFEVLIVNDGSRDDSLHICEESAKKDDRVRVISKPNEGVSVARNTGIEQAKGRYLMFLDADDYLIEDAFAMIYQDLKLDKDFIAYSYYTLFRDESVKEERYVISNNQTEEKEDILNILLTSSRFNTCWGKVYKTAVIKENKVMFQAGVKTGEDTLFVMEYLKHCTSYLVKNDCIVYYRQTLTSVMHQQDIFSKLEDFKAIYIERKLLGETLQNNNIMNNMNREFFSVITDLFLQTAKTNSFKRCKKVYQEVNNLKMVEEIVKSIQKTKVLPVYKRIELYLSKRKHYFCLASYFKLKATLTKYL